MNSKSIRLFEYKLVQKSNKPANVEIEAKILIYSNDISDYCYQYYYLD